jgi:hypothetical protein
MTRMAQMAQIYRESASGFDKIAVFRSIIEVKKEA